MAKQYTKNVWVDEVLADTEKYQVKNDAGAIVYNTAEIALATSVVTAGSDVNAARMNNIENGIDAIDTLVSGNAVPVKAVGSELTTGTDDAKYATAKALKDAGIVATAKASASEIAAGTEDAKFTTPKGLMDAGVTSIDGWIKSLDTWTYATATTFTISGDKTGVYSVGDKIKLTQTTEKFFYVVGVSYSSPNTTVTICGGTAYTLANATITNPYYSHAVSPVGFPLFFAVNNGSWSTTGTAFTNAPTGTPVFSMQGKMTLLYGEFQCNATSGGTGIFKLTFPAGSIPAPRNTQCGSAYNQNTAVFGNTSMDTSRIWSMAKYDSSALATNSQYFNASISYIVP